MIINTVTNHTIHKTTLTFNQIIIGKAMYTFGDAEALLQCFKLKWNCARSKNETYIPKKKKRGGTKRINRTNLKTMKTNLMCSRRL